MATAVIVGSILIAYSINPELVGGFSGYGVLFLLLFSVSYDVLSIQKK